MNPAAKSAFPGRLVCSCLVALTVLADPAAADTPVDLELVLAVDVSPSVDDFEAKQQRDGYLAALRHQMIKKDSRLMTTWFSPRPGCTTSASSSAIVRKS